MMFNYECGTCESPGLRITGTIDGRWLIRCLNGHELTPDPATEYVLAPSDEG